MYPLLLYLFDMKLRDRPHNHAKSRGLSETTQALLKTCAQSCSSMLDILRVLRKQSLLGESPRKTKETNHVLIPATETCFPFDLERVFSASFVSIMISFIRPEATSSESLHVESIPILDEIIEKGCVPAQFRKSEILHLHDMIHLWNMLHVDNGGRPTNKPNEQASANRDFGNPEQSKQSRTELEQQPWPSDMNSLGDTYAVSPNQILALAEMVDLQHGDLEDAPNWMDTWMWQDTGEATLGISDD